MFSFLISILGSIHLEKHFKFLSPCGPSFHLFKSTTQTVYKQSNTQEDRKQKSKLSSTPASLIHCLKSKHFQQCLLDPSSKDYMDTCISTTMLIPMTISFFICSNCSIMHCFCTLVHFGPFFLLMIYLKHLSITWDLFHSVSL